MCESDVHAARDARARPAHGLLRGKRVAITAAAGTGIGAATAQRLLDEGASVALSDRHEGRLRETAARLRDALARDGDARADRRVAAFPCDVASSADVERFVDEAGAALDGLDVFVANAGLGFAGALATTRDEDWQRVLDVSLGGAFRCVRAALRALGSAGGGAIVTVSSVTARRAERGQTAYAAAKAGVLALTRCAAVEGAEVGVRVNAVVPTVALHEQLLRVADARHLDAMIALQPQRRAARVDEIADAVVFLASDLSSYMTGEALSVSGQHA